MIKIFNKHNNNNHHLFSLYKVNDNENNDANNIIPELFIG